MLKSNKKEKILHMNTYIQERINMKIKWRSKQNQLEINKKVLK